MTDLYPAPDDYDAERDGRLCDLADCGDWLVVGYGFDPEDAALIVEDWQAFCAAGRWAAFQFEARGLTVWGRFVGTTMVPAKRGTGPTPLKRLPLPAPKTPARDVGEFLRGQVEHRRCGARA